VYRPDCCLLWLPDRKPADWVPSFKRFVNQICESQDDEDEERIPEECRLVKDLPYDDCFPLVGDNAEMRLEVSHSGGFELYL